VPRWPKWPQMTIFEDPLGPHITKHQRNRGNFWNNGPKGPCFNPKPCRFYWHLAKIRPKSTLNDPKNDPKLCTSILVAVENNEIFAPHLHCKPIFKNGTPWKHKTHVMTGLQSAPFWVQNGVVLDHFWGATRPKTNWKCLLNPPEVLKKVHNYR
jgi:hypothetical protein